MVGAVAVSTAIFDGYFLVVLVPLLTEDEGDIVSLQEVSSNWSLTY